MSRKNRPSDNVSDTINVARILEEFEKSEKSPSHRKGTFKIAKPFDEALQTILKAKPEPQKAKARR